MANEVPPCLDFAIPQESGKSSEDLILKVHPIPNVCSWP